MKLIETPPDWQWAFECVACRAKCEAELSDLEKDSWKVSGYHYNGTAVSEWKCYVYCPVCKKVNFVPNDNLNRLIWQQAKYPYDKPAKGYPGARNGEE